MYADAGLFGKVSALLFIYIGRAIAATSTTALASSTAQCWYPDKSTEATTDRPCGTSNDGFVACCAPDNICLTNGYCVIGGVSLGRGSCTDKSWSDGNCPQQCRDGNPSAGGTIVDCFSQTLGLIACDSTDNCENSSFKLPSYNYILRDYQVASFGLSSAVTITTSSATTSPSATTTSSGTLSSSLQSGPPPISPTCTAVGLLQAELHSEQQKVVAVGAGVGVPLGVLFLTFLALFLLERRKRQQTDLNNSNYTSNGQNQQGFVEAAKHERRGELDAIGTRKRTPELPGR